MHDNTLISVIRFDGLYKYIKIHYKEFRKIQLRREE